jgi:methanethiol S-methyltransferase
MTLNLFLGLSQEKEDSESFKSEGLLAKMRHPLYTATLMLFWGWFLFSNSYNNLAFALANTLYIFIGIQWEEKKLIKQYGQKYIDYKSKVPMLIPKIRP